MAPAAFTIRRGFDFVAKPSQAWAGVFIRAGSSSGRPRLALMLDARREATDQRLLGAVVATGTFQRLNRRWRTGRARNGDRRFIVNTRVGVLFVLGALLVLGDGSLADFALALLLGLLVGTALPPGRWPAA